MPPHWLTGARSDGGDHQRPSWPWSWRALAGALVRGPVTTTTLMTVMGMMALVSGVWAGRP